MTATGIPTDLGDPTIEHRFLGLDRRLIWPTLAILALVLVWGGVVPTVNEAVEGDPLEPGTVLTVASAVEFTSAEGWRAQRAPLPSNATVTLFKDGVTFSVAPGAWDGTADELLDELVDEDDPLIEGSRIPFTLGPDLTGTGVDTSGLDSLGFLAALVSEERFSDTDDRATGIRVESSSDVAYDVDAQQDIAEMLASIRVIPFDERSVTNDEEDGE